MKYRIKNIRREGWVETEEKLFRPSEDVTPVTPVTPVDTADSGDEGEIYIIRDDESAAAEDSTVIFTPAAPEKKPAEKASSPFAFLKTKEGKLITILVGAFAFILILFTVIVIALTSGDDDSANSTDAPTTDHVHSFETIVNVKATCTEKGVEREKCSICGYTTGEESVDALGHKWKRVETASVDATCEAGGKLTERCERCDETQITTLDPLDHDWKEDSYKQPTCEENGWSEKTCKVCGESISADIPAKGHMWIETTKVESTCDKEGEINSKCANCKVTKTEATAKKEHTITDISRIEPTCTADGKESGVCSVCNNTIVTIIEKIPHRPNSEATCTSGEICDMCGEEVSDPLPHELVNGICIVCQWSEAYDNQPKDITVGESMTIAAGIRLMASQFTVSNGTATLSFTLTINDKQTITYAITPEYLYIQGPQGDIYNAGDFTVSGNLFNLPSSGTEDCSISFTPSVSGTYMLYITGQGGVTHTCSMIVK